MIVAGSTGVHSLGGTVVGGAAVVVGAGVVVGAAVVVVVDVVVLGAAVVVVAAVVLGAAEVLGDDVLSVAGTIESAWRVSSDEQPTRTMAPITKAASFMRRTLRPRVTVVERI